MRLARGDSFWAVLEGARWVDELPHYTQQMYDLLGDILATDWQITAGRSRSLPPLTFDGVPADARVYDHHSCRVLATNFDKSSISRMAPWTGDCYPEDWFFSCHLVRVENCLRREQDGIDFLRRQPQHLTHRDEYLAIVAADGMTPIAGRNRSQ